MGEDEPRPRPSGEWGWDPAAGPPGESRFQPSRRARTVVAVVIGLATLASIALCCVAGRQLLHAIIAPLTS